MAEPILVQGPIGVGHIDAFFQESAGQKPPGSVVAWIVEYLILWLAPDVWTATQTLVRRESELIIGQDTEGGNNILFEILVLIISPHDDEIGLKGVDLLPDGAEGAEHSRPVRLVGSNPFIIAEFQPHRLWPVGGILHVLRNTWIAV